MGAALVAVAAISLVLGGCGPGLEGTWGLVISRETPGGLSGTSC